MTELPVPIAKAAAAGVAAGGAAIAAAELAAGLLPGAPSLVVAMGDLLVALQPPGAKDLVIGLFGTNDKVAVNLLVLGVALALGGLFGVVARRSWPAAVAGFSVVGAVLVAASLREPLVTMALAILVPVAAVAIAVQLLAMLLRLAAPVADSQAFGSTAEGSLATMPDWHRRRFLLSSAGIALASLAAGLAGRRLLDATEAVPGSAGGGGDDSAGSVLPAPAEPAPPITAESTLDVAGLTPLVVPNGDFYRIDTALVFPRIDVASWRLTVKGMVDREVELGYGDLLDLPSFEQYVTIACVSNEVGGNLVGNAKWQGVHLREVLAMAGVKPGATQIVGRSVDGFTVGFPTAWAMDPARDPMIAIGMNGVPLPVAHGYPARLIVPGLYGYVSATKWLEEIELTTLEAFDAYWVPLGWAKEAPILTQSRIDVPRQGARVPLGRVAVGGVAWAPDRGVAAVEVRVQGGDWQRATISTPLSNATWVQWRFDWDPPAPGIYELAVRAIDGTGAVQEERSTRPAPDGARGYHWLTVQVA